jgi:hypothetical protein
MLPKVGCSVASVGLGGFESMLDGMGVCLGQKPGVSHHLDVG